MNGNRLDNRRGNLRVVTNAQQRQNVRHPGRALPRGIHYDRFAENYYGNVKAGGKT